MFSYTIDSKPLVTVDDNSLIDLSASIFDSSKSIPRIIGVHKVIKEYEMRPDLVSYALYGSDIYTELILKYSGIENPFAVQYDDLILESELSSIVSPISSDIYESKNSDSSDNTVDIVKNYHKYIDPDSVPESSGSESNESSITSDKEANISYTGDSGITVKNGKIYFGNSPEETSVVKDVDESTKCVNSGVTIGQFLSTVVKANK